MSQVKRMMEGRNAYRRMHVKRALKSPTPSEPGAYDMSSKKKILPVEQAIEIEIPATEVAAPEVQEPANVESPQEPEVHEPRVLPDLTAASHSPIIQPPTPPTPSGAIRAAAAAAQPMNAATPVEQLPQYDEAAYAMLKNTSERIRFLHAAGWPRGAIAKKLGKLYQHVRNVLVTPVKKA